MLDFVVPKTLAGCHRGLHPEDGPILFMSGHLVGRRAGWVISLSGRPAAVPPSIQSAFNSRWAGSALSTTASPQGSPGHPQKKKPGFWLVFFLQKISPLMQNSPSNVIRPFAHL
jgi:hypothetical protein